MLKLSLAVGTALETAGTLVGVLLLYVGTQIRQPLTQFVILAVSWAVLLVAPHCLVHFIVGSLVGIRFRYFFVGRSSLRKLPLPFIKPLAGFLPLPGIRVDRKTLQGASKMVRAIMFASGTAASMLLPLMVSIVALAYAPLWIGLVLMTGSLANIVFTAYFSPKVGDLSRAR